MPDVKIQFHRGMSSVGGELTRTAICHADSTEASRQRRNLLQPVNVIPERD
jgi:hypothetical protein